MLVSLMSVVLQMGRVTLLWVLLMSVVLLVVRVYIGVSVADISGFLLLVSVVLEVCRVYPGLGVADVSGFIGE